jgi:transmembrane sensor
MTLQKQIDELLAQRASQWTDILRKGNVDDAASFAAWVGESPRNLDEFLTIAALDRELEDRELYDGIDREALLQVIAPVPFAQLQRPRHLNAKSIRQRPHRNRWWMAALAASIAVLALLGFATLRHLLPAREFKTSIGELRSLELPDGSLVYLNARSSVKLRFDSDRRDVELTEGEALFKVARDPWRPFEVRTRDALVEVLGTQFNISSRASGTRVAVLEGRVQISPVKNPTGKAAALAVGEAAQVQLKGKIQVTPRADIESVVAWRERRLVFVKAPLEEIVTEFNRFNRKQLRLADVEPEVRHYSGTFDADDPEALIAFLAREHDLAVEENDNEILIRETSR